MNAIIVNITRRQYFVYDTDYGYENIIKDLISYDSDQYFEEKGEQLSFWDKNDKIVFAPERLHGFVRGSLR